MEFKGGWEQYTEDYCFIQNTYWVHFDDPVPEDVNDRHGAEIGYYQWVPIMLVLQALMFFIPEWIWKTLNKQSGLDLDTIVKGAKSLRSSKCNERKKELEKLASFVEECLEFDTPRHQKRFFCFNYGYSLGSYVTLLYLLMKSLFLINIFSQFIILNNFLGTSHSLWGFQMLLDLWQGREWLDSGVFPRVTMCDFKVRRLANIHRYSVQCVLMINMFNEKIYLFIWFWFLFVAASTLLNFVYFIYNTILASNRERTARLLLLHIKLDDTPMDQAILRRFVHKALRPDGILLLRFVDMYAGGMMARDLCGQLFADFYREQYHRAIGSHTTKSSSPGPDDGFTETQYDPEKLHGPLMQPDAFTRMVKGKAS
ncbi:Innexin inx-3, putative [Brugia malayi]|nr:Innexin inx-3, putative [Brugia malayi]CDP97044.1 BMA-INX-3, isoform b [Brugia malayi]VIO85845.1 Innexin inx-3, putative [Brugia malayi]